jgi:hypothetical protein
VLRVETYLFGLKAGRYILLNHRGQSLFYPCASQYLLKKIRTVRFLTMTGHSVSPHRAIANGGGRKKVSIYSHWMRTRIVIQLRNSHQEWNRWVENLMLTVIRRITKTWNRHGSLGQNDQGCIKKWKWWSNPKIELILIITNRNIQGIGSYYG